MIDAGGGAADETQATTFDELRIDLADRAHQQYLGIAEHVCVKLPPIEQSQLTQRREMLRDRVDFPVGEDVQRTATSRRGSGSLVDRPAFLHHRHQLLTVDAERHYGRGRHVDGRVGTDHDADHQCNRKTAQQLAAEE